MSLVAEGIVDMTRMGVGLDFCNGLATTTI